MKGLLRRLGPAWRVQRRRHPRVAARLETAAIAARGGLADEVRTLRDRLAELERDHLLLAAHVATLTVQLDSPARAALDADDEAARQRARLAAIAFYEERIGRLEQQALRRGHARSRPAPASSRETSGERQGAAS